jgi:hypothetical protein
MERRSGQRYSKEVGVSPKRYCLIAEFRELSSLTPEALATQRWFHPFTLDAQARLTRPPIFEDLA